MTNIKKMLSMVREKLISFVVLAVIIGITVVGVNGLVKAYQSQQSANVVIEDGGNANISITNPSPEALAGVNEGLLGGEATTSQDLITTINDLIVQGCIALQDDDENEFNNLTSNIICDCTEFIDFTDATETPVFWRNRKGTIAWFHDETQLKLTDMATTSVKLAIGTTSGDFIDQSVISGFFPTDTAVGSATAEGFYSILYTGNVAAGTNTSTARFIKEDFQGADTRDGSGERHLVPVLPDERVVVIATATPGTLGVTGSDNLLDGTVILRYFLIYPE